MTKLFCDSNCELRYELIEELGLSVINMPYVIDGEMGYFDMGKNPQLSIDFFNKMRNGAVPKTQALNQHDYIEAFEPVLKNGDDILYLSFSHKASATFEMMEKAIAELKEKYPERTVTCVDTKGLSMIAGQVVLECAKLHKSGATDAEVISLCEKLRQKTKGYYAAADLVYLKRGGRLSGGKAMMGTLLGLKPIISMDDGATVSKDKAKGRKNALKMIVDLAHADGIDTNYPVFIPHADCENEVVIVERLIKENYPDADIHPQFVGPVIGSHCGPDTLAICFMKK
ncbi:MAG: DegV family protein [Firmicutes bacterium]|nr:DegV family protein [Bacillota bacterium]